ncbi:hypothetical protein K280104A7_22670 [Candidatus Bariatricus faecipullorum]
MSWYRTRMRILTVLAAGMLALVSGCGSGGSAPSEEEEQTPAESQEETGTGQNGKEVREEEEENDMVMEGTEEYRGFLLDNVLHSGENGDIHYNLYVPESYDGSRPYALFITLSGYEGLYFQGVGENLYQESFGFEAQNYISDMIILAPQLEDWGETSASQTIALTEYFLEHYNIDTSRVYIEGYSGGGETLSLVLGSRPELYTAALHCSSQWDGAYEPLVENRTPLYFVIGENDEYYSAEPAREAYDTLHGMYREAGLSEEETGRLLVLDVKDTSYFTEAGVSNQHGGGNRLFAEDEEIMGWLFGQTAERSEG